MDPCIERKNLEGGKMMENMGVRQNEGETEVAPLRADGRVQLKHSQHVYALAQRQEAAGKGGFNDTAPES